jgi:tetratricopeptide (TPR) repeat protein
MLRLPLTVLVAAAVVALACPVRAAAPPMDPRVEKAKLAHESGQYDDAIALCREVLETSPGNGAAITELMRSLYAKGEPEEVLKAGEAFVAGGQMVPAEAYLALGGAYESLREDAKAAATYRDGMAKYPTNARLPFSLGVNRMQAPDLEGARQAFAASLALDPRNTNAWLYVGKACQELGLAGQALVAYGRFLVLEPTSPRSSRAAQAMIAALFGGGGLAADQRRDAKSPRSDAGSFPEGLDRALRKLAKAGFADQTDEAFWRSCALAYFEDARRARHLEAAAHEMRRSLNEPEITSWLASHDAAVQAFRKWSQDRTAQTCRPGTR